jgi:hypothetical protein
MQPWLHLAVNYYEKKFDSGTRLPAIPAASRPLGGNQGLRQLCRAGSMCDMAIFRQLPFAKD